MKTLLQKLNYSHNNPVKADLSVSPTNYRFSSAKFYHEDIDEFNFLTHFNELKDDY